MAPRTLGSHIFKPSWHPDGLFFSFLPVRGSPNEHFFYFQCFVRPRTTIFLIFGCSGYPERVFFRCASCSAVVEQCFSLTQLLFHEGTTYTTPHHTLKNHLLIFYERKNISTIASIFRSSNEKILSEWKSEKSYLPIKITGIFFCTRKEIPSHTRVYVTSYLFNGLL